MVVHPSFGPLFPPWLGVGVIELQLAPSKLALNLWHSAGEGDDRFADQAPFTPRLPLVSVRHAGSQQAGGRPIA